MPEEAKEVIQGWNLSSPQSRVQLELWFGAPEYVINTVWAGQNTPYPMWFCTLKFLNFSSSVEYFMTLKEILKKTAPSFPLS